MRIIAVGRMRDGPEAALVTRYRERIRPVLDMTEVAEARGSPAEIKRREGAALLAALPSPATAIVLDVGGRMLTSETLAAHLDEWLRARPVCFLIGGAEGLDSSVVARAAVVLSLGPLTWPHMLARAMLTEQIFRARAISAEHPYHRSGRPG
jgi:23S rRNA (pseudouridine1915-N3)-methyltransferase